MQGHYTKLRMWIFFATIGGPILVVASLLMGQVRWTIGWVLFTAAMAWAGRKWSRRDPMPMPYAMRWVLLFPRPYQTPRQLMRILDLQRGERLLEIGPGIGVHALPIASSLAPNGVLDVLDIQQEMLNDLVHRATQAGITNIVSTQGDARKLPYPDRSFDGAYLIGVLGEIPDRDVALQELRRVLKPNARLVIGEIFIDPDFVRLSELQHRMSRAGFAFEGKSGPRLAYLARFKAT